MRSGTDSAIILDGKKCAAVIQEQLCEIVAQLKEQYALVPRLDVLLIGDSPASISYVTGKKKAAEKVGIHAMIHHYPASISLEQGVDILCQIQNQAYCHGVLVQLPLPDSWSIAGLNAEQKVIEQIQVAKDVDGFTVESQGLLFSNSGYSLKPCTPMGIIAMMKAYGLETEGKNVCIIGRSHIVGNPISHLLSQKPQESLNLGLGNATVTQCNSHTKNLTEHCRNADIIISATGAPDLVNQDMLRQDVVLIDVGINQVKDATRKRGYRLVGDIDFEAALSKASYITPVPGGVGPMTITMLLYNTIQAFCQLQAAVFPDLDWHRIEKKVP